MMRPEPSAERFDCVGYVRKAAVRFRAEIASMDHGGLTRQLRGTLTPSGPQFRAGTPTLGPPFAVRGASTRPRRSGALRPVTRVRARFWAKGAKNGTITRNRINFEVTEDETAAARPARWGTPLYPSRLGRRDPPTYRGRPPVLLPRHQLCAEPRAGARHLRQSIRGTSV